MDGRPESERIEIELTSNVDPIDGQRGRHSPERQPDDQIPDLAARQTGDVVIGEPVEPSHTSSNPSQRRLYTTATLVGVFALLLGWLIGRAGGTEGSVTPTETTAGVTIAVTTTLLPGEAIPGVETTTTIAASRPTTTVRAPTLAAVELDPRVAGVELTLVGVTGSRELVELDLASQTLLERPLPPFASIDTGTMVVGDDWIVFGGPAGESLVAYDDGTSETVNLGEPWQPLWQPGTGRFWRIVGYSQGGWAEPLAYEEIDLHGDTTGATIDIPPSGWAWSVDADGDLIVDVAGKYYSVGESSAELVAPGVLLGVSSVVAVARDCDARLRCGVWVTDRETGEARELEASWNPETSYEPTSNWGGARSPAVSPDGTMCAAIARSNGGAFTLGLIDLGTGEFVQLGEPVAAPTVIWSPDGRFAFFLGAQGLEAYDRSSRQAFPVLSESQQWIALGGRPSGS